jgi:hypothetical protein
MLISTVSYFAFFAYIMKGLGEGTFNSSVWLGGSLFLLLFALILGASALWMPLTNLMITNPSTIVWISIRVVLAVVSLTSLAVFVALLMMNPRPTDLLYYSALIGMLAFTIHTGVLDAILWPYLWSR